MKIEVVKFTEEEYQEELAFKEDLILEYKNKLNTAETALRDIAREEDYARDIAKQALEEIKLMSVLTGE